MRPTPAGGACLIWAVIGSLRFAAVAQEEPEPEPQPPTISDISFSSGSPLGAQRLGITGSGFTTNFHDGANDVFIGSDSGGWTFAKRFSLAVKPRLSVRGPGPQHRGWK